MVTYPDNPYLQFLLLIGLWFLITRIVIAVAHRYLERLAKKTRTTADERIIHRCSTPASWMLFLAGTYAALPLLPVSTPIMNFAQHLVEGGLVILLFALIMRLLLVVLDLWGEHLRNSHHKDDALLRIAQRSIYILGWTLAVLVVLEIWGVEVGPLLASLGIAGFGVAFALQSTLSNVFGGISMVLDKSYGVGDWVDIDGVTGVVDDVGIRSTKIRTWDNEIVTIPNGKAAEVKIKNFTKPTKRIRVNINFGVAYGSDIKHVQKVVLAALQKAAPDMLKEPAPYVLFDSFGESSLRFIARFWIPDINTILFTKQDAMISIYQTLKKEKITIPFPQIDVHLDKD